MNRDRYGPPGPVIVVTGLLALSLFLFYLGRRLR